jgi:hypothetical protein
MKYLIAMLLSLSLVTGAFACDKHKSKEGAKHKAQCHCHDHEKVQK